MKKNKILITGGFGYIGSHITIDLIDSNYDLLVVDNFSNSSKSIISKIEKITNTKIKYFDCDICDLKSLENLVDFNEVNCIIHLASFKSVNESIQNPSIYFNNNLIGLVNLVHISRKYNIRNFVFSSSACVYSENNLFPVSEIDGNLSYTNPYAHTKLLSENILKCETTINNNFNVISLRYFNPLGNHESYLIGDYQESSTNIMPLVLKAYSQKQKFKIFGSTYSTKDGTCERDFIHVCDLARAHKKALLYLIDNNITGFNEYNVGTGLSVTVKDLIDTFNKVNNTNISYEFVKKREGDLPICYANVTKIKKDLHWEAQADLQKMCNDSFNFFKMNNFS